VLDNEIMEKVREANYLERAYVISDHRRGVAVKNLNIRKSHIQINKRHQDRFQ
jgi:hypothetical protein